ncbi:hypothetical protein GM708_13270 [Vibrio cholerae]|nr:hypothetical protein [Vibrio cholerae]
MRLGGTWVIFRDDIKEHLEANYNTKPEFDATSSVSAGEKPLVVASDGVEGQDVASEPTGEDEQRPVESTGRATSRREELQRIRQWAKDNGYTLSSRGRVSQSIVDAYNEAQK